MDMSAPITYSMLLPNISSVFVLFKLSIRLHKRSYFFTIHQYQQKRSFEERSETSIDAQATSSFTFEHHVQNTYQIPLDKARLPLPLHRILGNRKRKAPIREAARKKPILVVK